MHRGAIIRRSALADETVDMFRRGVGPTVTPKIMGELRTRVRKAMPACTSGDKTPYSKVMGRFGARMTMLYKEEQVPVQKSNFDAPTTIDDAPPARRCVCSMA